MTIPDRMRELMAERRLTIEGFADLLGEKLQRVKDVLREKQRVPESMLAAMQREHFDVGYVLTGVREAKRQEKLAKSLGALSDSTSASTDLELPRREGEFVRDVLYGVAIRNSHLVRETIENYVVERQAKAAKKAAKKAAAKGKSK